MGVRDGALSDDQPHSYDIHEAEIVRPLGRSEVVLVCEHASAFIPSQFRNLGLSDADILSHIGWDPGAGQTANELAKHLDAVLIKGSVSRLVYDLNRPPESPSAVREKFEGGTIPGNSQLSEYERERRVEAVYRPFRDTLADKLKRHHSTPVLVTLHSFTPVFNGQNRVVEIGVIHDTDSRLADAVLAVASGFNIRRNEPYSAADGVTHTLREHALPHGLLNVMIEIRNDLIATSGQCRKMALHLKGWIEDALALLRASPAVMLRA